MAVCLICLQRRPLFTRLREVAGQLCCVLLCQRCRAQDDRTILDRVRTRQAETDRRRGAMVRIS